LQRTSTIFPNTKGIIKEDNSRSNSNLDLDLELNSNNSTLSIREDKVKEKEDIIEKGEDIVLEDIDEEEDSITY